MIHAEEFIDAVLATLRADLPAQIDTINSAKSDFQLLKPADDGGPVGSTGVAYSTGTIDVLRYPWVEVALPDFTISNFAIGQIDADFNPVVILRAFYQDAMSTDHLDRAVKRYGKALVDVISQPGAFGPSETIQQITGGYRVNPESNDRDMLVGAVLLRVTMDSVSIRT